MKRPKPKKAERIRDRDDPPNSVRVNVPGSSADYILLHGGNFVMILRERPRGTGNTRLGMALPRNAFDGLIEHYIKERG